MLVEVNTRWTRRTTAALVNHGANYKGTPEHVVETARDGVHITLDREAAMELLFHGTTRSDELYNALDRALEGQWGALEFKDGVEIPPVRVVPRSVRREQWEQRGETAEEHSEVTQC